MSAVVADLRVLELSHVIVCIPRPVSLPHVTTVRLRDVPDTWQRVDMDHTEQTWPAILSAATFPSLTSLHLDTDSDDASAVPRRAGTLPASAEFLGQLTDLRTTGAYMHMVTDSPAPWQAMRRLKRLAFRRRQPAPAGPARIGPDPALVRALAHLPGPLDRLDLSGMGGGADAEAVRTRSRMGPGPWQRRSSCCPRRGAAGWRRWRGCWRTRKGGARGESRWSMLEQCCIVRRFLKKLGLLLGGKRSKQACSRDRVAPFGRSRATRPVHRASELTPPPPPPPLRQRRLPRLTVSGTFNSGELGIEPDS